MNKDKADEIKIRNLNFLAENNGFQFTDTFFPYTSGEIGPYYVQSAVIQDNPFHARQALRDFSNLVAQKMRNTPYDAISGGETRDWIFSIPIALERLGKSHVMLYKDGKSIGTIKGKIFAHIADLNNEGSSPRDYWIPMIRKAGGTVDHIFFYVDRLEKGTDEMKKLGLESYSLISLDKDAWDYLSKIKIVTPEVYKNLMERGTTKEQRDDWAIRMLRSNAGIERLIQLITDQKTIDKAAKILSKGYPGIEPEIRSKLEPRLDELDKNLYVSFWNRIVSQRQSFAVK